MVKLGRARIGGKDMKNFRVVTYSANSGFDYKLDYNRRTDAVRNANWYVKNGWDGAGVYNLETEEYIYTNGDFDIEE